MSTLFDVFGEKKRRRRKIQVMGEWLDKEYIQYCAREDRTLKELEANLHITDDPEEIAIGTLKTACDFYDGDWADILSVDMDLGLWTPVWWYKVGRPDHTQMLLHEFESFESLPSWIQAMQENEIIILPDTSSVKESLPGEYEAYRHLRANSLLAAPFKPNPVGFLVIRNPKRYVDQPGMMVFLAYVLHRAMAQKKTMDSAKMTISPENITKDIVLTDIRCKAMWAQNDRETLRKLLLAREQSASMERTKALQAEVNAISKRLPELDRLIMSAYEDKVLGRVPESVCIQLLNQYEAERREKQDRRKELTEQLAVSRENEKSVDAWLDMMQDYAQLEELDRPTLVRLIEKIVIGDRYTVDDHEERDIHIYYNFVGYIEIEE